MAVPPHHRRRSSAVSDRSHRSQQCPDSVSESSPRSGSLSGLSRPPDAADPSVHADVALEEPDYAAHLAAAVQQRLLRETLPFVPVVREYGSQQQQLREAVLELGLLRRRAAELEKANELLEDDLRAGKGGGGGAGVGRLKDLERKLADAQFELAEANRTSRMLVVRYEDQITAARAAAQDAEARARIAGEEVNKLRALLTERDAAIRRGSESLADVQQRLTSTEEERAKLEQEWKSKAGQMAHVKVKFVRKHCDEIAEANAAGTGETLAADFQTLRAVVEDAIGCAGDEVRPQIRDVLLELGRSLDAALVGRLGLAQAEWLAREQAVVHSENWADDQSEDSSYRVRRFFQDVSGRSQALCSIYLPCDVSWKHWRSVCLAVGGVVQQLAVRIAGSCADDGTPYSEAAFRANTLMVLLYDFVAALRARQQEWEQLQLQSGGILRSPSDGPADFACLADPTRSVVEAQVRSLCAAAARAVLPPRLLAAQLSELYTIDMQHYKRTKHKDHYTRDCSHLKPATGMTMGTVLLTLEQSLRRPPLSSKRLSSGELLCGVVGGTVVRRLSQEIWKLVLDGGPLRWFHPEQASQLTSDVRQVEGLFQRFGVPRDEVSNAVTRLLAVVMSVMSQPSDALIRGGQACVPYVQLPETSSGSIWTKCIVRQVLAHRKDKPAKDFTKKHPPPKS
eukprot:TRINITY_DN3043_c0_g1_i1.p1 TRINITY_DN3043_c0_g1~~TRINITY_DN3043_c0_g1_i1.p1  ORF type:complete len:696 (+),score=300.78 TRINITY_DN3043_c0_g1_i1:47-2089(+)